MVPYYKANFKKQYKKLPILTREQCDDRITLFLANPLLPELNNHKLSGEYEGCRSVNVTGNIRAIYRIDGEVVIFIAIGTHPELYE